MANPHAGSTIHGQAVAKASPQGRPVPLAGAVARKGGQRRSRGGDGAGRRGGRPLVAWLPAGKGSRHLRSGSSDGSDGANGARGWKRGGDSGTHDAVAGDHDAW
ncbi:hypothetical protein BHM03_00031224 [Ensete ventricosum]|nr:hypothetical protein BHM03_00031224 [Ensete ventricosum]